ncbi:hypothetical protein NDR87_22035 [Nocardia sp. CDC159]|uniref:Uncharacterized protein n=1 Tax=Nocardia pulmonis TaxID=2951408 RepID=A0A9X2J0A4_9NOCA|nr:MULTISPECIES: hypothetical protein [Nocardia]MCM6776800.1 hypothetical protein [Nocardia pulmonis]MCM6789051.1 hypothetical protein [Nocardia sp. CDC159]
MEDAAPCGYTGVHPVLRRGSTGEAVTHAQCLLVEIWSYDLGPSTGSSARGLTVEGIAHESEPGGGFPVGAGKPLRRH